MELIHGATFIFSVYRPQDDGKLTSDRISERIDNILTEFPTANFYICSDFNTPHKAWLDHSNKTDAES